jgi:hypothetical protein
MRESPGDKGRIVKKSLQAMYQLHEEMASKVADELQQTQSALKEFLMINKFEAMGVEKYKALVVSELWVWVFGWWAHSYYPVFCCEAV